MIFLNFALCQPLLYAAYVGTAFVSPVWLVGHGKVLQMFHIIIKHNGRKENIGFLDRTDGKQQPAMVSWP